MTKSREIKKALTKAFKGVKFSVTTRNVSCETITIKWIGGAFISQVKEITDSWNTFEDNSDLMSDYFEYRGTQIEFERRLSEEELNFVINGILDINGRTVDDSLITFTQTDYDEGFAGESGGYYRSIASAHNEALEAYHWNGMAIELESSEAEECKSDYLWQVGKPAQVEVTPTVSDEAKRLEPNVTPFPLKEQAIAAKENKPAKEWVRCADQAIQRILAGEAIYYNTKHGEITATYERSEIVNHLSTRDDNARIVSEMIMGVDELKRFVYSLYNPLVNKAMEIDAVPRFAKQASASEFPTYSVIDSLEIKPAAWMLLQPAYQVIADTPTIEPIQINLFSEVLEARRDRWEEKQARKAESYERLADKHESLSSSHYQSSKQISDMIPFGQPILIGHHSEKRHRRDANKIWDSMGKSVEHQKTADYYKGKLAAMEGNTAISSDDPGAIAKLEAKLAEMVQTQEQMKLANKIIRKKQDKEATVQELRDKTGVSHLLARELLVPDFCGKIGYPDFRLQNNNANIRRVKERIDQLKKDLVTAVAAPQKDIEYPELGLTVTRSYEANRMQLFFDSKPPTEVRTILKTYGFRWSPSEGAWQRHLNNAKYATDSAISKIQELQAT